MKLHEIAHCRTGDKGNWSTLSVFAYEPEHYPLLERELTAERVRSYMSTFVKGKVTRYLLPGLSALHFVLEESLAGGVTRSLQLDRHGKSLGTILLALEVAQRHDSDV